MNPNPAFPRMISKFVRQRAAAFLPPRDVESLRLHLLGLLKRGEQPPAAGPGIDWKRLAAAADIEPALLEAAKTTLQPGLEALRREIKSRPKPPPESRAARRTEVASASKPTKPKARPMKGASEATPRRISARSAQAINEADMPVDDAWDEPDTFHATLALHMSRHGDTPRSLLRAILAPGETFETSTIITWRSGRKAPQSAASLALLGRIEIRYRLPAGYFKAKLPHQARAITGHLPVDIPLAERRRLAWHLPDDFADRPIFEQEEILEWVQRVVVSGSTDYRRY
jgi:hypothetical protein